MIAAAENVAFASNCSTGGRSDPCRCALPQDNRFRARRVAELSVQHLCPFLPVDRTMVGDRRRPASAASANSMRDAVTFAARQLLDTAAPSNFLATNPTALARTGSTGGTNLAARPEISREDLSCARLPAKRRPGRSAFKVGEDGCGHARARSCIARRSPRSSSTRRQPIACGRSRS